MSISMPKELKEHARYRAEQDHFGTPSDYIRSLIREDLKRHEQKQLELYLLEGVNSGEPIPMTKAEWKKLRAQAHKGLHTRKQGKKK